MRQIHKLLLTVCLILAMLLQTSAVYATEARSDRADVSHSAALSAGSTEASVAASTNTGIITGLENGRSYYIMNAATGELLATRSLTDMEGNRVNLRARSEQTEKQWELTVLSNSQGILTWVGSPSNKVVTLSGDKFILSQYAGTNTQKLTIIRIHSGAYRGLYRIKINGQYLAISSTGSYPYLTSVLDEYSAWSFRAVDNRCADIYSFDYSFYNENGLLRYFCTTQNDENFNLLFNTLGYSAAAWPNETPNLMYTDMTTYCDIFVYRGHGGEARLALCNTTGVYGHIAADSNMNLGANTYYLSDLDDNELASLKVVLFIGCSTGLDYPNTNYNLVDEAFDKGASFVLGTTETTQSPDSNKFLLYLMQGIADAKSMDVAINEAVVKTGTFDHYESGYYPIIYKGDGWQYLNFNAVDIDFQIINIIIT